MVMLSEDRQEHLRAVCRRAKNYFGDAAQAMATVEEFAELSAHLCRFALNKPRENQLHGIREEIVDCIIMLEQMKMIFFSEVEETYEVVLDQLMEAKLDKLTGYLNSKEGAIIAKRPKAPEVDKVEVRHGGFGWELKAKVRALFVAEEEAKRVPDVPADVWLNAHRKVHEAKKAVQAMVGQG